MPIKVLFICHGNICRSPMAEYLFKESCATSSEEIGNPVHYGTKRILNSLGIDCSKKRARRINPSDYQEFDYLIIMDENNRWNLNRIIGNDSLKKVHLLLEYAKLNRDISDPWYTGDFNKTYNDIMLGLNSFYSFLMKK